MKQVGQDDLVQSFEKASDIRCGGRREFVVRSAVTAGGLLLGLSDVRSGNAEETPAINENGDGGIAATDEMILKLSHDSPLSKVGGFLTAETPAGKVIVARTGESTFAACSAVCPHRGGAIEFDVKEQKFFCPLHFSTFDLNGNVLRGPAKRPLEAYGTESAAIINLKKM